MFDNSLLTASWVNSAMAASAQNTKNPSDDMYGFMPQQQQGTASLDFVSMLGGGYAQPAFSSPLHAASNFDTESLGVGAGAGVSAGVSAGAGLLPPKLILEPKVDAVEDNALQLEVVDPANLSPTTTEFDNAGTQSGYPSPALQLSPSTPGLTMCSTVDSTPAPRTHSRCSSRSSFSFHESDGTRSGLTSAVGTPASTPGSIRKVIGGHHGRKNSAVANGTFTPKRPHLCTYADCERSTRTFRSNADLQRHLRSHMGERPYACPAQNCGKAYGQQNKMVKHVEQQHPMLLPRVEMNRTRTRRAAAVAVDAASRTQQRASASLRGPAMQVGASAYMAYARQDGSQSEVRPFHTSPLAPGPQYTRPAPYPHPAALAMAQQQLLRSQQQQPLAQPRTYTTEHGSLGPGIQLQPAGQTESQWWATALNQ